MSLPAPGKRPGLSLRESYLAIQEGLSCSEQISLFAGRKVADVVVVSVFDLMPLTDEGCIFLAEALGIDWHVLSVWSLEPDNLSLAGEFSTLGHYFRPQVVCSLVGQKTVPFAVLQGS